MQQSENINDLAAALAKAQGELEGAAKAADNPHFRTKYADLGAVWEAWQEVGPKHGLAVVQFPADHADKSMVALTTMLLHSSGQWMRETFALPCSKQDAQGYGSALTYLRRYALQAMVGIAPVDDDGNAAVGNGHSRGNTAPAQRPQQAQQTRPARAANETKTAIEIADEISAESDAIATQYPAKSESFYMAVQTLRQCHTVDAYNSWWSKTKDAAATFDADEQKALNTEKERQKADIARSTPQAA